MTGNGRVSGDDSPFNQLTPIGLLLKELDVALTEYVDRTLRAWHGLGRAHWQILSTVHDTPGIEARSIAERGRVLFAEGEFDRFVGELTSNGWMRADDSAGPVRLTLTEDGLAMYRKARGTQAETRARMVEGLSEEDYAFVIHSLERMLGNAERAMAEIDIPVPTPSTEDDR